MIRASACIITFSSSTKNLAYAISVCRPGVRSACSFILTGTIGLAKKLDREGIAYVLKENAFFSIDDFGRAQHMSDHVRVKALHQALDIFAERYCPVFRQYNLVYRWSIMQVEYSTDIVFKRQADLKRLYESLVRTAIHSVKPENMATFFGLNLHWKYEGEIGNNFNTRILGTRIKHQMGTNPIKMYDKFGIILRIKTTSNNVSQFKIYRKVQETERKPKKLP